jgi:hypothetical protein
MKPFHLPMYLLRLCALLLPRTLFVRAYKPSSPVERAIEMRMRNKARITKYNYKRRATDA